MQLKTVRGYDFYEVSSAMQKAIRRGDTKMAGYFALELFASGYRDYVWKRLFTISAEDCANAISAEVDALYRGYCLVSEGREGKGRIFVSKAVILLCRVAKSRDADHLQCLVYDKMIDITDAEVQALLDSEKGEERLAIPEYAFDCHTKKGKHRGKSKDDFFREEHAALFSKQKGLFDNLVEREVVD